MSGEVPKDKCSDLVRMLDSNQDYFVFNGPQTPPPKEYQAPLQHQLSHTNTQTVPPDSYLMS